MKKLFTLSSLIFVFMIFVFINAGFGQSNIIPVRTDVSGFPTWTDVNISGTTYLQLITATSSTTTPSMNFDVYTGETLNFKARTYGGGTTAQSTLTVSINTGAGWIVLGTRIPITSTLTAMTPFDLSSYNGTSVQIKFESLGASSSKGIGIDDIAITGSSSGTVPPVLSPDITSNDVDNNIEITFTEDVSWRDAITSITIGGTTLNSGYSVTPGKITFTPSASNPASLLQTSGINKTITVIATGYSNAVVLQTINPGISTKLGIKIQPTAPVSNGSVLATQPAVYIQDQYGNTTTSTADVVAAVGSGTWLLGGTTTKAGVNGTAAFTDLTATSDASVSGATIVFSSAGLTPITSATFNIPAPSIDFISLIGSVYTQDFNTLSNTGTSSTLPTGWYFVETGTNADGTYTAGTGSSTTGDTYSFGLSVSTERCFGSLFSSSLSPKFGAKIKNSTGQVLTSIKISYTGETWRVGAVNRQDKISFQYSTDATSLTSGTWIDFTGLDYQNPGQAATGSGSMQHSAVITNKLTGLNIADGSAIWIRWTDNDATGADDGMGIDDLSISALAPIPSTQSNSVQLNYVNSTTYNISWAKGNGSASAVFVKLDSYGTALPEDGITYNSNPTIGLGDQIGTTGWYCVYNGPGTLDGNVNITGFTVGQTLTAMVCEYNGSGISTNYNTSTNASNPTSGTLPVSLLNLSYISDNNKIILKWTTTNEINNSGFDVERKTNTDSWTKIGFVTGKGKTGELANYSFEDNKLNTGKYHYRLKQIDFNGNFKYYELGNTVEIGVPKNFKLSQNYPNPFNPITKIDFELPFDSKVRLVIFDILGREIKNLAGNDVYNAGYYTVEFNASNLSSGTFLYRIVAGATNGKEFSATKKMVILK